MSFQIAQQKAQSPTAVDLIVGLSRRSVLLATAAATATTARNGFAASTPDTIRGVWVAGPQHNTFWRSADAMRAHMAAFAREGLNTAYLCVLNHGRTHYRSRVMQAAVGEAIAAGFDAAFPNADPLQAAIEAGKEHGIRVGAWLEFGFASHHTASPVARTLLGAQPGWASLDASGQPVVKNGFHWMDALNPEVQAWMTALVTELSQSHPGLHTIQGDDRMPAMAAEGGYSAVSLKAFGTSTPPPATDKAWTQWRADQLTEFLSKLRTALRQANPQVKLSLAPSPWPWGRDSYLQDWPAWVARGLCDELIVQLYRREVPAYERLLKATLAQFNALRPEGAQTAFASGMLRSLGAQVVVDAATQAEMLAVNARNGVNSHVWFHSTGTALF